MKDLFGVDIKDDVKINKLRGVYQKFRFINEYQESKTDKKCKNCKFLYRFEYHDKIYSKCELQGISHSATSDVKLRNVCKLWEEDKEVLKV